MKRFILLGLGVLAGLVMGVISLAAAQTPPPAFTPGALFAPAETDLAAQVPAMAGVERVRYVRIDEGLLRASGAASATRDGTPITGDEASVTLNLFDDLTLLAAPKPLEPHPADPAGYVWSAEVAGGDAVFAVSGGLLEGAVAQPGVVYQITPAGADGVYAVQAIALDTLMPLIDTPLIPPVPQGAPGQREDLEPASATNLVQVDYLVLYTAAARAAAGGTTQIENAITASVSMANQAYINSGIFARLNLVGLVEVAYTETGVADTDLRRLATVGDGFLEVAQTEREARAADIVHLVLNTLDLGGLAYLMQSLYNNAPQPPSAFAPFAYGVLQRAAITGGYATVHEAGHNMGMDHDRANKNPSPLVAPFIPNVSFGWQDPDGRLRDVMGYSNACKAPCPMVNQFSGTTNTFDGIAMGNAQNDGVTTLNQSIPHVAAFRTGSGSVVPTNTPLPPAVTAQPTVTPTPGYICTANIANGDVAGLIAAITAANADAGTLDTICLAANGTYTFTAVNNGVNALPVIASPVAIVGNNALLTKTASSAFRFFEVAALSTLTLAGVQMENGYLPSTGNFLTQAGGAVLANFQAGLNITGSTFKRNQAISGGAVAILGYQFSPSIKSTLFQGNSATQGGAVFIDNRDVTGAVPIAVEASTFYNNAASTDGAEPFGSGLHNASTSVAAVTVTTSCFVGNSGTALSNGAALALSAINNWWGTSSGPTVTTNGAVPGPGAQFVSINVTTAPFALGQLATCPGLPALATSTPTATSTASRTPTATQTATATATPTATASQTATASLTPSLTNTPLPTNTPTPFIVTTFLTVTVPMSGRPTAPNAAFTETLNVVFINNSTGTSFISSITTDTRGRFVLTGLLPGSYTLWIKGDRSLAELNSTVTIVPGANALTMPPQRDGDADDNNVVNISDFSLLASTFGLSQGSSGYDRRADFNRDNIVNISDFSLLASVFGQSGPAQP